MTVRRAWTARSLWVRMTKSLRCLHEAARLQGAIALDLHDA